jgi:prepilin-type N-terminal cleavage/methylation domain-containing protein
MAGTQNGRTTEMTRRQGDGGYTLIELLLVIVVLGILATIVIAAAGGFASDAEDRGCAADALILATAIESYFAQAPANVIPPDSSADPSNPDRYELQLVAAGLLRATSERYDVEPNGELSPQPPCMN